MATETNAPVPPPERVLPPVTYPADLPVSARRDDILAALARSQVVIIAGETGSGKTTQLPKMLLEAGVLRRGVIGHTQPRRIAARAVAARLEAELPGAPPRFVGHKIRFSDGTSRDTAIKVMTDGILLAEARQDPLLRRYDALIVDEAHERSLNIDFLLGCLQRILRRRRDLKLVVTSATIDTERFARYFGDAPVIEVSGRSHPVETRYRPLDADDDDRFDPGLNAGIVRALEEITAERGEIGRGDVLVFLPGEREIREAAEAIEQAFGPKLAVLPLYSRLAWADQQRIFDRRGGRRVVLSTNVAETSLTVPGIRAVIDSGLARLSRYSPRTKILRLPIEPVSQASANQRRGRCGRVGPGLCIRLYSEADFEGREAYTPPEVLRTNLASVILQMEVLGLGSPVDFPFIDPPDTRLINDGYRLLEELEAVDAEGKVTETGRTIARFPVDPRLGRVLVAARRGGAVAEVLVLAAGLSIQDPRERPSDRQEKADAVHAEGADPKSDFLTLLQVWGRYRDERATRSKNALRRWCAERFLSAARMREWEELEAQLRTIATELQWPINTEAGDPQALHRALLSGFLGNVGVKTDKGDFLGPRGRRFVIAPGTPLRNKAPRWVVAATLVETQRVYARLVAAVEPAWIESVARHLVKREYTEPEWDEQRGLVTCRESVTLWGLALASGRRANYGSVAPVEARDVFVREALVHGRSRIRCRALSRNRSAKERLRAEEAALRQHTVVVDEPDEAALYVARLPPSVHSVAAFERWRREPGARDGDALLLTDAQLRQPGTAPLDRSAYPLDVVLAGNRLPVTYHFDPLAADDGATVTVPEALVARLSDGELGWGVPAWLSDKVTAIIRGLPKPMRRLLVPAPDAANKAVQSLDRTRAEAFDVAVAAALTRLAGETIPVEAVAAVALEPYLRLNLRVMDSAGRVVAEGRELAAIRRETRRYSAQQGPIGAVTARPSAAASAGPWERDDLRSFDFGVIPAAVEVVRQGVRLDLHPTLIDGGTHVASTLVADPVAAERGLWGGIVRLWVLALAGPVRHAEKLVLADRDLMLLHQGVGAAKGLARDIAERAVRRECAPEGTPVPRTVADFNAALERGRPSVVTSAERLAGWVKQWLSDYRAARAELARLPDGCDGAIVDDLRAQLEALVYEGFVRDIPEPWLEGWGRYLKALRRRLTKLPGMRGAVADAQFEYLEARRRYARAAARAATVGADAALLGDWRWLLEEYAVQLFAQDLRTRVPISAKRLAAVESAAVAALARL
jgi:ATP-dependent helicase HrpA